MWTAQALGSIKMGFVWIQLLICAVVLVMVPFYRLDKEMPAVRGIGARRGRDGALRGGCFGSSAQAGQRPRTGRILPGCAGCIGRGMVVH